MEARKSAASRGAKDAIAMLKADHQRVHRLCEQFGHAAEAGDDARRRGLAERICQELEVHAQLEEELFYPAVRAAVDDDDLMDEAQVEHQSAKDLIRQIRAMSPGDALFDAKVKVLGEYVHHHVGEEEDEMFPKAKKARVDLADLARRMAARRTQLESERSMAPFDTISAMLMVPIRAAASAARAGAAAGRRAASAERAAASAGRGRKAAAGRTAGSGHTAASGRKAAAGRKPASAGARGGATAASSGTRAATRASAGGGTRASVSAGRTAAAGRGGAAGGRAVASVGTGRRGGAKAGTGGARRSKATR